MNLSQTYLAKENREKAMDLAKKALAIKKNPLRLNQMGLVLLKLGKNDEAIKNFSNAYKIDKNFEPAYINEALVYIDFLNVPPAAIEVLDKLIKLNPNSADAFFQMGRAMAKMGMLEQAAASFNQAIYINQAYRDLVAREIRRGEQVRDKT